MKKFKYSNHKKLWEYIAEHPNVSKGTAIDILWPDGKYGDLVFNCFACDYTSKNFSPIAIKDEEDETDDADIDGDENSHVTFYPDCTHCPLYWPKTSSDNNRLDCFQLFSEFVNAFGNGDKKAVIAKQIAELDVKEDVEWE